jgi:UDP-N-acetylmuramoyl-tripeptide--D-alanyl-D-alanine ligase
MIEMTTDDLASACGGRLLAGSALSRVDKIVIDSREVTPGACFFAIAGARTDGHSYLESAASAGASALVVHDEPGNGLAHFETSLILVDDTTSALQRLASAVRERVNPKVVAITGSIGKTSTRHFATSLLQTRWDVHSTPGNLNNHWGLPLSLLGLERHHEVMVAELAMSGPGEIRALARIARPDVGVITNVAPVHMEFFENVDGVAAAKAELAEELSASGTLIVNGNDQRTAQMATLFQDAVGAVVTFGIDIEADVRARYPSVGPLGWQFELEFATGASVPVTLPLTGEHTLMNFLAAAAIAHALEVRPEAIAARTQGLTFPAGRGGIQELSNGVRIIDDSYNASPEAMKCSLDRLAGMATSGRRIWAAGDMLELGDWSEDAHREVGEHAGRLGIDALFAVGDYASFIAAGAESGGIPATQIACFDTAGEAGRAIAGEIRSGDLLLVKGSRGVHMEHVIEALRKSAEG